MPGGGPVQGCPIGATRNPACAVFSALLLLLALCGSLDSVRAQLDEPIPAQCWPEDLISQSDYPYCRLLDQNFALHWGVSQQTITFAMFVSGKYNFVGLGMTQGGLTGADIWMARSDDAQPWLANPWHADDFFSVNASTGPVLDAHQDITLTYVEQTQTYTYIALTRDLDTCDRAEDFKVFNDTDQLILFAYGAAYSPGLWQAAAQNAVQVRLNPMNFNNSNVTNTTASYYLEMYTEDPQDLQAVPITTLKFPVPTNVSDLYRCVNLDIGTYLDNEDFNLNYKYHVIRYGGINSTSAFHHATLFACSRPHDQGASPRYTCSGTPPPYCSTYFAIWTPSTGNVSLPKDAGLPLGLGSYRYFTLVVHYHNAVPAALAPGAKAPVDSSGIVLYLTRDAVRASDAAVLKLGAYTSVPAAAADGAALSVRSVCPASCTAALPAAAGNASTSTPVKMFAAFFKMPASGRAARTHHVRSGVNVPGWNASTSASSDVEIQPVATREYWNSSYQWSMTVLPQSRLLLPGDSLVTECDVTYAASDPLYAQRAYCQSLVMYFPARPGLSDCGTYDGPIGQPAVQACGPTDVVAGALNATGALAQSAALVDLLDAGNVSYSAAGTWALPNGSLYIEPCQQYVEPVVVPMTGKAVGGIVGVTVALSLTAWFLWARYGRHDDAERQQLIEEMRARLQSGSLSYEEEQHFVTSER